MIHKPHCFPSYFSGVRLISSFHSFENWFSLRLLGWMLLSHTHTVEEEVKMHVSLEFPYCGLWDFRLLMCACTFPCSLPKCWRYLADIVNIIERHLQSSSLHLIIYWIEQISCFLNHLPCLWILPLDKYLESITSLHETLISLRFNQCIRWN